MPQRLTPAESRISSKCLTLMVVAALIAGCDSKAASGTAHSKRFQEPDNIIIKETFVLARPDIVTAGFNKAVDELCPTLPHVSQAAVEKMYSRTIETYISGRSKTVIKKEFRIRGVDDPCNSLGSRVESVSIDKPRMSIIVNKNASGTKVEITDFSKDEMADFAFDRAKKSYAGRVKFWKDAQYSKIEKIFGHECGYQEGVPTAFCTLLPNPLVIPFKDILVLKAPPHKPAPGCDKSAEEALKNVPVLSLSGKCLGDMVHTIQTFAMNVAMPVGIFEIPEYARDVKPVVKVIE